MRIFTAIFLAQLAVGVAEAQQPPQPPKWDVAGSAALFQVRPGDNHTSYGDDWYFSGRYSLAVGRYWTEHLKTEVEYAISNQGSTYLERFTSGPATAPVFPYSVEAFHRLEQASARLVWQFGKNTWVHPYVSGGLVVDRDRQWTRTPARYQYPSGRTSGPTLFIPETTSDAATAYRVGATVGAGAKIYMTQSSFFHTGAIATYAKPAATLSLLAGFGLEF